MIKEDTTERRTIMKEEPKITIELEISMAKDLHFLLMWGRRISEKEQEACEKLASYKNEDGTLQFPKMQENVEFWKNMNSVVDTVNQMLVDKIYKNEKGD